MNICSEVKSKNNNRKQTFRQVLEGFNSYGNIHKAQDIQKTNKSVGTKHQSIVNAKNKAEQLNNTMKEQKFSKSLVTNINEEEISPLPELKDKLVRKINKSTPKTIRQMPIKSRVVEQLMADSRNIQNE